MRQRNAWRCNGRMVREDERLRVSSQRDSLPQLAEGLLAGTPFPDLREWPVARRLRLFRRNQ